MFTPQWLAASAALLLLPLTVHAQQEKAPAPADAAAPGPALRYESAFAGYAAAATDAAEPDRAWRAANDEMGRLGGHAGHLKQSPPAAGGQHGHAQPMPQPMPAAPAAPMHHH